MIPVVKGDPHTPVCLATGPGGQGIDKANCPVLTQFYGTACGLRLNANERDSCMDVAHGRGVRGTKPPLPLLQASARIALILATLLAVACSTEVSPKYISSSNG